MGSPVSVKPAFGSLNAATGKPRKGRPLNGVINNRRKEKVVAGTLTLDVILELTQKTIMLCSSSKKAVASFAAFTKINCLIVFMWTIITLLVRFEDFFVNPVIQNLDGLKTDANRFFTILRRTRSNQGPAQSTAMPLKNVITTGSG